MEAQIGQDETSRPSGAVPLIAVIVLTWNGKDLTLQCLASLAKLRYPRCEFIVVDNGSTDGTCQAVASAFGSRVKVISNARNLGFSAGNNVGISFALKGRADYIMLLNNDTVVDEDLIHGLLEAMSGSSDIGIAGPKIYYFAHPDRIWFAGGEVFPSRGIARHVGIREKDRGQYDEKREVDYITGCAMMIRREVFAKIGLLDPSYSAYFEDTDFCLRARRAGYRILYVPEGKVWHMISYSTGGQVSCRKIVQKLRSSLRFFRRHAKPYHWLTIPFFFLLDVIRVLSLIAIGRIRNARDR